MNKHPTELGDYDITELSEELRRRGWRIVPLNIMALLAAGIATGFWPSNKDERSE